MRCLLCGFENRAGVRFCEECGTKLGVRCSACGSTLPPDRKFCGHCGQSPVEPTTSTAATLRIQAAMHLVQSHFLAGEYERAIALGRDELTAMPAVFVSEFLGHSTLP